MIRSPGRNMGGPLTAAVMLATLTMATAAGPRADILTTGTGDEALSVSGPARISLSLDGSGYFREIESGRLRLGMRWPGLEGTEFLGSGGLLLRFHTEEGVEVLLGPGEFESLLPGRGIAAAREGCKGGQRYPADGCDDDGDGSIDEDPLDGLDNDGDGEIDEDFAAVGDGMYVTSAAEQDYGIHVTRRLFFWNYGHIRDFIGFSTKVEYLPPEGGTGMLRDFEMLQYIDFEIGDRDDPGRGRDDRIFFLQRIPREDGPVKHVVAAAAAGGGRGPVAAVIVFQAGKPGTPLGAVATGDTREGPADSLWSDGPDAVTVLGSEAHMLGPDAAVAEVAKGDVVLTHRFGPAVTLHPGDALSIDWAIVFGKDEAALIRNISRAHETWKGLVPVSGPPVRWVVPARKATRVVATASLAPVWVQGEKRPAASIDLPAVENEEIEWLRISGLPTDDYETVSGRIIIGLSDGLVEERDPFTIEGQLTDGTIFTSYIGENELHRYAGETDLQPGRLPDDSIRLFPNPFADNLNINIRVHEPASFARAGVSAAQSGISSIRVYDIKGRLVRTILSDEMLHPGEHIAGWDGTDDGGMKVAPGVYYCRLKIGERSLTRRVILLR